MDLSFARFDRDYAVTMLPTDLAVLLVGVAARQAASPTARLQAGLTNGVPTDSIFSPAHGAFSRIDSATLTGRQQ